MNLTNVEKVALYGLLQLFSTYETMIEEGMLTEREFHTLKKKLFVEYSNLNDEYCGHCDSPQYLDVRIGKPFLCTNCGAVIYPCSMCEVVEDRDCIECPWLPEKEVVEYD